MYERLLNTISSRPSPQQKLIQFGPWTDGLVTETQPEQMSKSQLFEALNVIQVGYGSYRTRNGSTLVSSGLTGNPIQVDDIKVGSTWYTLITDTANKLYYNDSGTATAIATLEGQARFVGFMGLAIISDGSFLKVWNGTTLSMMYDNGTGDSAYQVNKRTQTPTTTKPLGNGTVTAVTYTFTTQAWTAGYTIPPTHLYATMYKVGTPTGTVTAKIKRTSDNAVMASKAISTTIADFVTDAEGLEYEAIFTSSDITTQLSPSTSYYISLEYSGGDVSNYVSVLAIDINNPQVSLKPGMPPKSAFAVVSKDKLFSIEGLSGTNPGWGWYSARGDHLDWSTDGESGYVGVIDSSSTSFPVAGIASWNGSVWYFGSPRQPFLGQLTGATPSAYAIVDTKQRVSGDYKSIIVTPDDIVFAHPSGVDFMTSIQEYAQIGVATQTDDIRKTIQQYFTTDSVAGYDPEFGLYLLKMPGTDYVYVVHTRAKSVRYRGKRNYSFSPCTRFLFNPGASETVTCFGNGNGFMYYGTTGKKVYKIDKAVFQDNSRDVTYKLVTNYLTTGFGDGQAVKLNINAFGRTGGSCVFRYYRNSPRTYFHETAVNLPVDSELLTVDADMLTVDADFLSTPANFFDRENINFNYRTLMVGIEDIVVVQDPIYFGGFSILTKKLGGL
jgi:hypothetical protein